MTSSSPAVAEDMEVPLVGDREGYETLIEANATDSQDNGGFNAESKKLASKRRGTILMPFSEL
jgi:hypothetical protein